MKVLVTAATKHGSTAEIATALGTALLGNGLQVDVVAPEAVTSLRPYDAVIVGSGVYAGHWLEPAKAFVERFRDELRTIPVWLFSSGPIGDPALPGGDPADVSSLAETTNARGHQVFAGRIDPASLGMGEKLILKVMRVPEGDFRPWESIDAWAAKVTTELRRAVPAS